MGGTHTRTMSGEPVACQMHASTRTRHSLRQVLVCVMYRKDISVSLTAGIKRTSTNNVDEISKKTNTWAHVRSWKNTTSLFDTSPHSNTARRDVRYSFCKAHSRGFTRNIGMNKSCPEAICSQCWLTTSMSTVCSIWRKT